MLERCILDSLSCKRTTWPENKRLVRTVRAQEFDTQPRVDNFPTVSTDDWKPNDYREPEVGAGEKAVEEVDYGWGQKVPHAGIGTLPDRGAEARKLKFSMAPKEWSLLPQHSYREQNDRVRFKWFRKSLRS